MNNGRIRLEVYREEGGYYTPSSSEVSFIIQLEKVESSQYKLNEKGLIVDLFTEIKKDSNKLSNLKSVNALLYVLAGIDKKNRSLDDCLLLNTKDQLAEGISSNLFILKDGLFYFHFLIF